MGMQRPLVASCLGIWIIAALALPAPARPRGGFIPTPSARPDPPTLVPKAFIPAGPVIQAFNDTVFFGGTTWMADSMRWEAIEDSVWTFDSGVGSSIKEPGGSYPWVAPDKPDGFHAMMEGWIGLDRTAGFADGYFRRVSSADPRWGSSTCVGAAGGLGGTHSFWAGVFEGEADSLCYATGQGYGNGWNVCIGQSFQHSQQGGGDVTFEFDYQNETEAGFDFTRVYVEKNGVETLLFEFNGILSGHASVVLTPGAELPPPEGPATFRFCVGTDPTWSDEDGLNPTDCGAFAVDNVSLSGAITHFADFETDDGGWSLFPSLPGLGEFSNLMHVDDLPPIAPDVVGSCTLADSVLVFFDPGTSGHPQDQDNLAISPWIDLGRAGATGYPGKMVEVGGYHDLPLLNYTFGQIEAQWYPDTCSITGAVRVSPLTSNGLVLFPSNSPTCLSAPDPDRFMDFSNTIPDHAEQVRIAVGVVNWCRFFPDCQGLTNTTPWFDDVRFAVHTLNTIQSVVDAAAEGDTITITAGIYTGPGNKNIDFGGKNLVLWAPDGPANTVIDCEGSGRGFIFQSGEDSTSVVDGFTVRNGVAPLDEFSTRQNGGGIYITNISSPKIRNFTVESCEARLGGGIHADYRCPSSFEFCEVRNNTAELRGGGITALGFGGRLDSCSITDNDAGTGGGGAYLSGGAVANSFIARNVTLGEGGGVYSSGADAVNCSITQNQAYKGGGAWSYGATIQGCNVSENQATFAGGGLYLMGSEAVDSHIAGNRAQAGGGVLSEFICLCSSKPLPGEAVLVPDYRGSPVIGCSVHGNQATVGGGLLVTRSTDLFFPFLMDLTGTTVSGNRAAAQGGGIYAELGIEVVSTQSILWGNCADLQGGELFLHDSTSATFTCSAIDSSGIDGTGTRTFSGPQIFQNPLFCAPTACETAPTTGGIYTLAANSPCLPANSPCGLLVGAEGEGCTPVEIPGPPSTPLPLLAAYPNPFSDRLHLSFRGSETASTRIRIYDVQGRLVDAVEIPPGVTGWQWKGVDNAGSRVPPGVYFLRLRSGTVTAASRVTLLR